MSELREYLCVEALVPEIKVIPGYLMHSAKDRAPEAEMELVYLKSEADKVIADKDKEIAELKEGAKNLILDNYLQTKEIRHHKYNRCLAKAMWCESEEKRLEAIAPLYDSDKECWEYNSDYWFQWHQRRLELAEKFKEAK